MRAMLILKILQKINYLEDKSFFNKIGEIIKTQRYL